MQMQEILNKTVLQIDGVLYDKINRIIPSCVPTFYGKPAFPPHGTYMVNPPSGTYILW